MRPNLDSIEQADENFYFIADLHALTTVQNPEQLRQLRQDTTINFLACGFDPKKVTMWFQSSVAAHSELAWILSTVSPMGLLERAVSYKDKVDKGIAASVGLFTYPVLMAADILLYDATHVPVGKDQKQHLEMARDIAIKFNNTYGDTLVVPEPVIREDVAVVPGTDGQKMSKSYGNTIPLFGEEKKIEKAIMGIVSDSKGPNEPKDPDTNTIYQIHKLFLSASDAKALADEYRNGISYGDAKKKLFAAYMDHFAPMRKKYAELQRKMDTVAEIMEEGAAKASTIANETMERVKKAAGLL